MIIPPTAAAFLDKWKTAATIAVLLVIAHAATFYAGKLHERAAVEKREIKSVKAAVKTERDGVAIANTAGAEHAADLQTQLEKANAELKELRAALATVRDCPVPRRVVRLLDGGRPVSAAAGSATQPQAAAAPVAPDTGSRAAESDTVECRAVIDNCAWNRLNVCEPNAIDMEGLQQFYENLRHRFNASP